MIGLVQHHSSYVWVEQVLGIRCDFEILPPPEKYLFSEIDNPNTTSRQVQADKPNYRLGLGKKSIVIATNSNNVSRLDLHPPLGY